MMTRRHFRLFVFYPFAALTGLTTATWLATPFVAEHYLTTYFQEQGEDISVGKLSIDFFPPKADLKNIVINDKSQDTLTLKRAILEVEIWPLFTKTLHISEAKIEGLNLVVTQHKKDWIIAGINTSQFITSEDQQEPKSEPEENPSAPWNIKLPSFSFTDSQVNLSRQPDLTVPAETDKLILTNLSIKDLSGQELAWQGEIALSALINATTLSLNSQFDYSPEQASANVDIKNTRILIDSFQHFLPAPYNEGKGQLDIAGSFQFLQQQDNNTPVFDIKNLNLNTQIDDLDLPIGEQDKVSTKSTSLTLSKTDLHFVSADVLAATGTLDLDSTQSLFAQADMAAQFDQLTLNTPFNVKRDKQGLAANGKLDLQLEQPLFTQTEQKAQLNKLVLNMPFDLTQNELGLTATGDLDLQLGKPLFAQAEQNLQFDDLTLNAPFDIKQNNQSGLSANVTSTELNLNALAISSESLAMQNQQLQIALSDVAFTIDNNKALSTSLVANIQSHNLSVQQAGNTANYNEFHLSNALSLQKNGDTLTAKNNQLSIDIKGLKGTQSDEKNFSLGAAKLTADQLDVNQTNQQPPLVKGTNFNFTSKSLDSMLANKKRIASWNHANISGLSFTQQDKDFDASLNQFSVSDLIISELLADSTSKQALPPLTQIGSITVEQLNATQDGAKIKQITTDSAKVSLILDAQKRIENLVFVEVDQQKEPDTTLKNPNVPREKDANHAMNNTQDAEQNPAFKAPYYVILDAYDTTGKSSIYVQDKSTAPTLQRTLDIDTLSLRNLNTQKKDQATVLALKARNGKYATLISDITIWPLADKLTLKSDLTIREAELPPYSSYIANVLGYQIDSGQLDLDLKLNADSGVLSGNSHIVLREFDLGGRKESNSVIKAGAVPLNIAVGILKDSDNNIDLDIPLSGDIENPSFGWQDFLLLPVRKALYSASSTYLMQTFVPYANVISIAQFAGDQLLKIRVEPLIFNAEDDELNDSQDAFLKQLVALMKDKDDSQLKACGVASYLDLGFEKPPVSIDNDTKEAANNLAQKRADHLKDYLVKEGISSSRIFLCSPEVDLSKSSKPRVELNF
ncbi:DUF748 domain-containing protein [Marinomonas rhizomae]|uniref:Uncharacterized protein involved in outer membrane biogenesis n=1 Tax=Marinomonas rhizomae TaxID=491948 RepID=A0A366JFB1_9GAMM|nr:DUF748 domain-containing protein [Marinomonas rhizomae]RBP85672.1 uncharacterized protein involved in outer membrane biogenesis [Marinomonas rhizomae]RNF75703.1 DUF748 domain-containing protein [Marinomonas rhizomae]